MEEIVIPQENEATKRFCRYCQNELIKNLDMDVKVCSHCNNDQRPWVNRVKFSASATALLMVIIAIGQVLNTCSQVNIANEQYKETRLKRLEAEAVLNKAQNTFAIVSTNSNEMKIKTKTMLDAANHAVDHSFNTLKTAEYNANMAKKLTDNTKAELKDTKRSFTKLSVTLTEPVSTILAIGSNPFIYQHRQSKINQIENITVSLRKLGVSEDDIKVAIAPFVDKTRHDHISKILYALDALLPANKKIIKGDISYEEIVKWNLERVHKTMKENGIKLQGELKELILDLEFYQKTQKLRRPEVWQD